MLKNEQYKISAELMFSLVVEWKGFGDSKVKTYLDRTADTELRVHVHLGLDVGSPGADHLHPRSSLSGPRE